jgi:rhodanese-related sulfurtransferase
MLTSVFGWGASSRGYNYISPDNLQKRIKGESSMILLDVCPAAQFAKGHIPGSIGTNAYPVDTEAEKGRLAQVLPKIQSLPDDIVIICPRGGGGAKRTADFYKSKGVDGKRLLILEKGMSGWPFEKQTR